MSTDDKELIPLLVKHELASPRPSGLAPGTLVPIAVIDAVRCCLLRVPIWYWRQDRTYAFGRDARYSDVIQVWEEHSMKAPLDRARLGTLLQHPRVKIAVDPPVGMMCVSFEEAELLGSWGIGVTAWGTKLSMTFWIARSEGEAIRTLRELRKTDTD